MNIRLTQPLKGRSSSCSFSLCLYVCVSQCILLCILVFCPSYVWLFWHISLSVCVWKRGRGTQRWERWGERERGSKRRLPQQLTFNSFIFLLLFLAFHFLLLLSFLWLDLHICPVKGLNHIGVSIYFWFLSSDPGPLVDKMFLSWSSGPVEENERASAGLTGTQFNGLIWLMLLKSHLHFKNGSSGAPHLCSWDDVRLLSVSFQ